MKPIILSVSLLCVLLLDIQYASARDVQLRSRSDDGNDTVQLTRPGTNNTNTSVNTQNLSADDRLRRLERILESQGLVDMLVKIENLQAELQLLRGEIELHTHTLNEIKQRQRDLYIDIDRRLLRLERNGSVQGSTGSQTTTSTTSTGTTGTASTSTGSTSSPPPVNPGSTTGTAASKPASDKIDFAAEQKAYQQAFDLLREFRYDQAVAAFNKFIGEYPNGRYAHIAQYWIGEANYAQRSFGQAITDYQKLIDNYPNSPKLADAQLKIGYSLFELNRLKEAETTLNELIKKYPGTTEAGQAQNQIKKIRLKR